MALEKPWVELQSDKVELGATFPVDRTSGEILRKLQVYGWERPQAAVNGSGIHTSSAQERLKPGS